MIAIYKREFKSIMQSFVGFLFIGIVLFFVGLYYTVYCLLNGYPYFSYVIGAISFMFLFTVPILTMRMLAEERKNKTDQLILTAPISVGKIVFGKYLAALTVLAIPTLISCLYPLILLLFGPVPLAHCYLSILSFFLYGALSIAVGIFISSLTESQVIAAVLTFGALFLGYMMSGISSLISQTGNMLTKLLNCFDFYTHFSNLLNGTLNIASVFYFLSLTLVFLFLTTQSIQKRRYTISKKSLSIGAYSTGMILIVIAVAVIGNIAIAELPGSMTSIDVTSEKLYSLTNQTKEYLRNLKEDVTIYVISSKENEDQTLGLTLERYADYSDHITVTYIDPRVNPTFHTKYTQSSISMNSLIVVSGERSKVIDYDEIYETEIDYTTYSQVTTGYDGEGQITSAIDYCLSAQLPTVYFTTGHGESSLSDTFLSALKKENVSYEIMSLLQLEEIPEDAACVFINAPTKDFSADDADTILRYLENGGNVVYVATLVEEELPNITKILEYMNVTAHKGMIIEGNNEYYYRNPYYLLPDVSYVTATAGIYNQYYVFAPYSQGFSLPAEDEEGEFQYYPFLKTSNQAYIKQGTEITTTSYEDGDTMGSFVIGAKIVKEIMSEATAADDDNYEEEENSSDLVENTKATLVVYGCDQIFTDDANLMVSGANQILFTGTISEFVNHEITISIPVKSMEVSYLTITQSKAILLAVITTLVLPLGNVICGFIIWLKRRRL